MTIIETILSYKIVKDTAKKLLTWENVKRLNLFNKKHIADKAEHFHDYKMRMQTKFGTVSNSLLGNNALRLKDVFVPQYLTEESGTAEVRIDGYPKQMMRQHRRIVIKDYAGRGKSTLMRQMFDDACEQGEFPLFIQLRELNEGGDLFVPEAILGMGVGSMRYVEERFCGASL